MRKQRRTMAGRRRIRAAIFAEVFRFEPKLRRAIVNDRRRRAAVARLGADRAAWVNGNSNPS